MKIVLAALIGLSLSAPALAQETRTTAAAKFNREFAASDKNKDGNLTRAEVQARIGRMKAGQKAMDPAQTKKLSDLWFTRADGDKNGKVSQLEAQALLSAVFRRYDANGDGQVGANERAAARAGVTTGR